MHRNPSRLSRFAVVASLALLAPLATAAPARTSVVEEAGAISIAKARTLPLGSKVTVHGSVSTPSGAFESSFGDKGFGLQDASAGIYVSFATNVNTAPNDVARVTGILADHSGLLVIVPSTTDDVKIRCDGPKIHAERVRTADVGESSEGRIVRVAGTITDGPIDDAPYGFKFSVNDGSGKVVIFVNVQTGIAMSSLHLGQSVRITGFSSQYADHYEIDPRSPDDITVRP
ncbi:hypothetical protein LZC95_22025 [Pendulispora brunnea]|uniref:DNA-binding protein n=1 Tax=Pendulispora brunnea TaxID=2905690 RepID=A0ABZ2KN62_9BACT